MPRPCGTPRPPSTCCPAGRPGLGSACPAPPGSGVLALGDIERADRDYARVEALWAEVGQHLEYAMARQERGVAAHARGDLPTALAHLDHAQTLFDQLGIFEAELFVDKCTVLLAAGLARDALREVDAAVSTIEETAARRRSAPSCCIPPPSPPPRPAT